ncbi:hypothetical protein [Tepidibacillus decaturensis]|uniref:Uncharacterized protein n=1 Tax=Tepidibacillus decaturensis TaxID=1413211 RepID=A0A135L115_9BACI|nr:hypothetical protein [Tepidibacillus decaturensis]KXG42652.1 hypothetical protein U473_00270 [Tepidibacillus decaturensis]
MKSYEEFEKEFKDTEPKLNEVEQARKERIVKILNQKVSELNTYKPTETIKKNLAAFIDWHMEEIQIIENLIYEGLVDGKATNEVYQKYVSRCEAGGLPDFMNQIAFSQFLIKYFGFKIINKKIKGKKYRIFIIKEQEREEKVDTNGKSNWWNS